MRGEADREVTRTQLLDLAQVVGGGLLAEARQAAARVGGQEEDDRDAGVLRRLRGRERLVEAEVVELADDRVAGPPELLVDVDVVAADRLRALALRLGEHELAPGPEVAAARAAAESALEGMAVGVHEA